MPAEVTTRRGVHTAKVFYQNMVNNSGISEPGRESANFKFSMIPHSVADHGLSPTALALYVILMRYADNDTKKAFPSRQTLAGKLGMKKADSIDRYVTELCKAGLLSVRARWRNAESTRFSFVKNTLCNFQTSSEYTLQTEPLESSRNQETPGRAATRSSVGTGPSETGTNYTHVNETRDNYMRSAAPSEAATSLPDDWQPKPRHRRRAGELGVDIDIAEQKFREQLHHEKRTSWDGTFMRFLDVGADHRESDVFPSGTCEENDYPNGIFPTDVYDLFICDEYDAGDESDDDYTYDAGPIDAEIVDLEPIDAEIVTPISDHPLAGLFLNAPRSSSEASLFSTV